MKIDKSKISLGLVIAAVVVLVIGTGRMLKRIEQRNQAQYEQFQATTVQSFEQRITEQGQVISQQTAQIGTLKDAIKAGLVTQEELRQANIDKARVIVSLQAQIKVLNLKLEYKPDTVFIYDTTIIDGNTYLRVPMAFVSSPNKWYDIRGVVQSDGVDISSLTMYQEPKFMLGYRSNGLFKAPSPIVSYTDGNPYWSPIEMQNVEIVKKQPWHKTPNAHRVEGAAVGIAILKFFEWLTK